MKLVVVGAGISGLSAAVFAQREGTELTVLEASATPGGNVRTDIIDGRCLDRAANGWLDNEPAMTRLLEKAGLVDQIVRANDRFGTRWIFADQKMHPAPLSPPALVKSSLIPWTAKLRLLLEPFIRRGASGSTERDADETVGNFVRRRLGPWFVDRMVGPMVSGIYAADPDQLSLRGAFPRMFELEREHRSLFLAMLRLRRGGAPRGHLVTMPGGAGALTQALASTLGDRLHCDTPVRSLEKRRQGWRVHTDHQSFDTDGVILACPGHVQARLMQGIDPVAADALAAIPYAPVAVVVTAWPKDSFPTPPDGFGVLMARGEDRLTKGAEGALGTVFTSSVFPQQSRPDELLLRTILGGGVRPEVAGLDDQALLQRTLAHLGACLGTPCRDPALVHIVRHPQGIPQYTPGHLDRVRAVRSAEARNAGLVFCGNHLDGIGVKDCARAGEVAARRIYREVGD